MEQLKEWGKYWLQNIKTKLTKIIIQYSDYWTVLASIVSVSAFSEPA